MLFIYSLDSINFNVLTWFFCLTFSTKILLSTWYRCWMSTLSSSIQRTCYLFYRWNGIFAWRKKVFPQQCLRLQYVIHWRPSWLYNYHKLKNIQFVNGHSNELYCTMSVQLSLHFTISFSLFPTGCCDIVDEYKN